MTSLPATFDLKRDGDTATIHVTGEIDLSNAASLQIAIVDKVGDAIRVVLDLGGIVYLDSQGIRLIYQLAQQFTARGAELTVVAPTGSVAGELIRLTQLQDLVTVVETS